MMNYCTYCDARCWKMMPETLYWNCTPCGVRYFVYQNELAITEFTVKLSDDKKYKVELHYKENKTKIIYIEKELNTLAMDWDEREQVLLEVDQILNFKPTNIKDKLQTILLFS